MSVTTGLLRHGMNHFCQENTLGQTAIESQPLMLTVKTGREDANSKGSTRAYYEGRIAAFYRFSYHIGDIQTMTLTHPKRPPNPLPARLETLKLFVLTKILEPGVYVTHDTMLPDPESTTTTTEPSQEVPSNAIPLRHGGYSTATGDWSAISAFTGFSAAISALYNQFGHLKDTYHRPCDECVRLVTEEQAPPNCGFCRRHAGDAQRVEQGNSIKSDFWIHTCRDINPYLLDKQLTKGNNALTPAHVLELRQRLLASTDPSDHQLWVMIILAIKNFLCVDETVYPSAWNNSYSQKHCSKAQAKRSKILQ